MCTNNPIPVENHLLPDLLTARELAKECGNVPIHRLKYALDVYDIQPKQRAGLVRLFGREQIPTVAAAIRRIANRREFAHAS